MGSHIGAAYACNTLGAIVGSLAGGFGLLPALSATGVWKFAIAVLAVLGAGSWVLAYRTERRFIPILVPAGVTVAALLMLFATGPTATWRQSAIGAGRANDRSVTGRQRVEEWLRLQRRPAFAGGATAAFGGNFGLCRRRASGGVKPVEPAVARRAKPDRICNGSAHGRVGWRHTRDGLHRESGGHPSGRSLYAHRFSSRLPGLIYLGGGRNRNRLCLAED